MLHGRGRESELLRTTRRHACERSVESEQAGKRLPADCLPLMCLSVRKDLCRARRLSRMVLSSHAPRTYLYLRTLLHPDTPSWFPASEYLATGAPSAVSFHRTT